MFEFLRSLFTMETMQAILAFFEIFFVVYLVGYSSFLFISVLVGGNEIFEGTKKRRLRNEIHHDYYVPISVVVPAYNEEVTIVETIRSLLNLDYRIYEIIVVNDGSKDSTGELVAETFQLRQVDRPIRRQLPCGEVLSVWEGTGAGRAHHLDQQGQRRKSRQHQRGNQRLSISLFRLHGRRLHSAKGLPVHDCGPRAGKPGRGGGGQHDPDFQRLRV